MITTHTILQVTTLSYSTC